MAVLTPTCLLTGPAAVDLIPLGEGELRAAAREVEGECVPPVGVLRLDGEEDMDKKWIDDLTVSLEIARYCDIYKYNLTSNEK